VELFHRIGGDSRVFLITQSQLRKVPLSLPESGFFYFKSMDLKTLLKQMDEYIRRTEGKSLIQKLEEDANNKTQ
jgi:hypothetical protein